MSNVIPAAGVEAVDGEQEEEEDEEEEDEEEEEEVGVVSGNRTWLAPEAAHSIIPSTSQSEHEDSP